LKTSCLQVWTRNRIVLFLYSLLLFTNVCAHDYSSLNEYQIDRTNDTISAGILQLQLFLGDMFRQKYISGRWPDPKLIALRDDLLHQQTETALGREYFESVGINIQSPDVLLTNPVAGRTVAAGQVVDTALALIKNINLMENQDAFIKEVYAGGQASVMYNLLAAHREKMDIYRALFIALPSPATTPSVPAQQTGIVPVLSYLFGGLGLCALITMLLLPATKQGTG